MTISAKMAEMVILFVRKRITIVKVVLYVGNIYHFFVYLKKKLYFCTDFQAVA